MTKKLLVFLACVGLASQMVSCTSNDTQADTAAASDFDSADLEALDSDGSSESSGDSSLAASEELPEEMLGESESTNVADAGTEEAPSDVASSEVAASEELPEDPLAENTTNISEAPAPTENSSLEVASSDTTYSDSSNNSVFESSPSTEVASSEESTSSSSSSNTTYVDSGSSYDSAPANVPLQKMATAPWKQNGVWYNAVYFARPGDTLSGISKAIYGSDKSAMLKKGNPTFQRRGVKPGDKVYYNSPNRPDDSARMLTYYEDSGMPAESYAAQPGENIRTISKKLLGYDNAWKEVWASNLDVDSKGTLSEGATLKYWSTGLASNNAGATHSEVAAAAPAEQMPPEAMAPPQMEDPTAQAQTEMPPPPPPGDFDPGAMENHDAQMAMNEMPPPPPVENMGGEEMAPPPPPMEMPEAAAPPAEMVDGEEAMGLGEDQMMILAGLGVLVGAVGFLMIRNKRKRREQEMHGMDNTHVGT